MALRIRLMRFGKKHEAHFRIVVKEARSSREGKYVEQVGFYSPMTEPETVRLNEERVAYWLSVGAKPTETVERLIKKYSSLLKDDGRARGTKPIPKPDAQATLKAEGSEILKSQGTQNLNSQEES